MSFLTVKPTELSDREKRQMIMFLLVKEGLTQADALEVLHEAGDKYPEYAAHVDTDDELEVDDKPLYSLSDDNGCWVSAWVFVRDSKAAP